MDGKVWIVGAGSEAGLITVRGLEAVRGAQVIIYDDLLDHALLDEAPAGCELICVGKRKNSHKKEQEEIHELLADRARRGLRVVRLKGGDPTVFGRGGEEALALQEAGIPYEMVPGVSTCISAPEHGRDQGDTGFPDGIQQSRADRGRSHGSRDGSGDACERALARLHAG